MQLLRKNIGLKVVSVLLAVLIWFIVINVSKPEAQSSQTVPLEILHQDVFDNENKIWEIDRTSVIVSYKVRADQMQGIRSSDFRAYVDLQDYSITGSVPIYVEVLNDKAGLVGDVTSRPAVAKVYIEDIQEKQFEIAVHPQGTSLEEFPVVGIVPDSESVSITGPESEVGRISEVGIEVDVDGLTQSQAGVAPLHLYDANGNEVGGLQNLQLSFSEVGYSIFVYKRKSLNLLSSVTGTPAEGYQYEGTAISPDNITLTGPIQTMNALTVLELPQIDIGGAEDNITATYNVNDYLPEGLVPSQNPEVIVTVRIERLPEINRPSRSNASRTEEERSREEGPSAESSTAAPSSSHESSESTTERHSEEEQPESGSHGNSHAESPEDSREESREVESQSHSAGEEDDGRETESGNHAESTETAEERVEEGGELPSGQETEASHDEDGRQDGPSAETSATEYTAEHPGAESGSQPLEQVSAVDEPEESTAALYPHSLISTSAEED